MDLTDKAIRWCWKNNYFVGIFPKDSVWSKIEVYRQEDEGIRTLQVGKESFKQKTDKEKKILYDKVFEVYQLIYKKYNNER